MWREDAHEADRLGERHTKRKARVEEEKYTKLLRHCSCLLLPCYEIIFQIPRSYRHEPRDTPESDVVESD